MASRTLDQNVTFTNPPIAEKLFNSTTWAIMWLVVRLYVGYQWLHSGLEKFSNPAWTVTGEALKGFWVRAVAIPAAPARPAIAFDWYRTFLQGLLDSGSYVWFAKVITAAELLIGIALILGPLHRGSGFLWRFHELELYDGRHCQHQPGSAHPVHPAGSGLEDCWTLGPRPLRSPNPWHTLAATGKYSRSVLPLNRYPAQIPAISP